MNTPSPESILAVKTLTTTRLLRDAFIVCQSKPFSEAFPDAQHYSVTASFSTMRDAHEFHSILLEIWQRANEESNG